MYICIVVSIVVPRREDVVSDHVAFDFTSTSVGASLRGLKKTCLDLLSISYDNILKKKDANAQVKLTFFYFLEKDRKKHHH